MGAMFGKFKGHAVKQKQPLAGGAALTKTELQELMAKKRLAAKAQEPETGEQGGPEGPEPTRYGDWEVGGRASDF